MTNKKKHVETEKPSGAENLNNHGTEMLHRKLTSQELGRNEGRFTNGTAVT